ncbi:MAG: serine hydrolase domain-containing protein [Candidatus Hodarchaeales archaeon]|jgi:CubicO group peptidase (beta-lactamase class C family)
MLRDLKLTLAIFSCFLFSIFANNTSLVISNDIYYPTNGWRSSSPEKQGMAFEDLTAMARVIDEWKLAIDSIHILRNGFLVYEKYYPYFDATNIHQLFSTTKSLTSILIGIANNSGFITNLDQPILELFTERYFANVDDSKRNITIRHLLGMECGIAWPEWSVPYLISVDPTDYDIIANSTDLNFDNWEFNPDNIVVQMAMSNDWFQFILDQPMESLPGLSFSYNSGASHLLSVILQKKTGMTTVQFAKKYLFDPLGIVEYSWGTDPAGHAIGGYGLWLTPEDMAKIGYLFLQNGTWGGEQVITEEWVHESTRTRHVVNYQRGYGYQWWIDLDNDAYYTAGFGGQIIFIKPDDRLIAVLTASEFGSNWPQRLISEYILKSVRSSSAIAQEQTRNTPGLTFLVGALSLSLLVAILTRFPKRIWKL